MPPESISVVIPVYNAEKRLPRLLESLRAQKFDQSRLEVIVVDDDSTDRTCEVACSYGAIVVRNGQRNCEIGKSIGIEAATHDVLLFLDDDHVLPHSQWLARNVRAFERYPDALGSQPARFEVVSEDAPVNRYLSIFGIGDPVVYYLGRSDRLMAGDATWTLAGRVVAEDEDAWVVEFKPEEVPTVGAQGFMTRRSIIRGGNWSPYYFHIDSCREAVERGHNRIVMVKEGIRHDHCDSIGEMLGKLHRNMTRFIAQRDARTYRYEISVLRLAQTALAMTTLVRPTYDAMRAFRRTRDWSCFLHVYLSVRVALLYGWLVIRSRLAR